MSGTLTVRLPARLRREIAKLSKQQGRPASELVRESLERYVAVEQFRALRTQVLPSGEAAGWLTDEDVFRSVS
jgi:predicted DNA-binding protein